MNQRLYALITAMVEVQRDEDGNAPSPQDVITGAARVAGPIYQHAVVVNEVGMRDANDVRQHATDAATKLSKTVAEQGLPHEFAEKQAAETEAAEAERIAKNDAPPEPQGVAGDGAGSSALADEGLVPVSKEVAAALKEVAGIELPTVDMNATGEQGQSGADKTE